MTYGRLSKLNAVCVFVECLQRATLNISIGAKLIYLPPYSPDFNPIEECFSFMKAWLLRHEREAVNPNVHPWLIHRASLAVTADDVAGWFGNCGYL
jgi:hypothetical protein